MRTAQIDATAATASRACSRLYANGSDPNDKRDNCRREQCPYHKRPAYSARWARILLLKGFEWWIRFHNTKHGEIDHEATAAVKKNWTQHAGGPKPPTIYKTLWTDKNGVPHQFKYARGGMYLPAEVYRELGNDPTVQALAVVLRSSFPHRGRKAVAARFLGRWLKVARSHQGRIKRITGWGVRSTWRPLVAYSRDDRVYADSQGMKLPPWRPAPASNAKIIAAVREAAQLPYEGDPVAGSKSCTWAPLSTRWPDGAASASCRPSKHTRNFQSYCVPSLVGGRGSYLLPRSLSRPWDRARERRSLIARRRRCRRNFAPCVAIRPVQPGRPFSQVQQERFQVVVVRIFYSQASRSACPKEERS